MSLHFRQFYDFSRKFGFEWKSFGPLVSCNIGVLLFETIAVAMLMPIMLFIERRGDIAAMRNESRAIDLLFSVLDRLGLPVAFGTLLLVAFAAILLRQIVTYFRLIESVRIFETLLRMVRHGMFTRFNTAMLEFQERTRIGELVNTVVVEARRTVLTITMFLELAVLLVMIAVYLGMLLVLSPALTGIVAALILVIGIGMRGLLLRMVAESRLVTASNSDMLGFLNERLAAPRLIRLCGMERIEAKEFQELVHRQVDTAVSIRRTTGLGEVVIEPVVAGTAFALIFIAYEILNMPLTTISVFLFIVLRMLPLAKAFVSLRQGILTGIGSIEVCDRLIVQLDANRETDGGSRELGKIKGDIALQNVSFRYPEAARPALSNINVRFRQGTATALVGPSGGGKSTLVDLLPRLRIPQSGSITIDRVPLDRFQVQSLRRQIAFGPQQPQIFDVTAAQHIRYGRIDADDGQVRQAAALARAADFIAALPNGYDTQLGPAGLQLSGGQKQRLDLARVLVADASLLIFDEPTSHLDNESEGAFRRALHSLRDSGDKTIVIIAHRLRMIDWVDQIVVLIDGRVEAVGTHAELLSSCRWYREAYEHEAASSNSTHQTADAALAPAGAVS